MHPYVLAPRRPAARLFARLGLIWLAVLATPSHAASPMVTDDARIVDARACQVESWVTSYRGSTEYSIQPACNITGNLELALGATRTNAHGHSQTTDVVLQGKTVLRPLQANGWGLALAAGSVGHPQAAARRDWYAYAPVSFSLRDDALQVHANVGWLRDGAARRDRLTWGLGTEIQLSARAWLLAETFGQNQGRPMHQLGLRYSLVPDRVQLDATDGNRNGTHLRERWFSIGLRLLTPAFLP